MLHLYAGFIYTCRPAGSVVIILSQMRAVAHVADLHLGARHAAVPAAPPIAAAAKSVQPAAAPIIDKTPKQEPKANPVDPFPTVPVASPKPAAALGLAGYSSDSD